MVTGRRSAWRRRANRNRGGRIAAILAIPVALGLLIGIVIVVFGGHSTSIIQTALGASASPSASSSTTPATTAAANVSCDIVVPANPLSAAGLATPYQLTGAGGMTPAQSGCTMTNAANLGAFVQATILNPATGQLAVYDPLVITQGTTPAVAPVVPTLPANAVVTIDFGFNGTNLTQVGATPTALAQGNCVNGTAGSIFGQVSFCNGINFFNTAHRLKAEGRLVVPSEGTSGKIVASGGALGTGQACPAAVTTFWSTRSWTRRSAAPRSRRRTWPATTSRRPPRRWTNCSPRSRGTSLALRRWSRRTTRWCWSTTRSMLRNGAAIAAAFNTTVQKATNTAAATMPALGQRKGRNHHQLMNPAGM